MHAGDRFAHYEIIEPIGRGGMGEVFSARGAMPTEEVLAVGIQIAAGLEEAHAKGIIHRDLKPANVMLTPDGRVKVLDFGLARAYQGEGVSESNADISPTITAAMTQAGVVLGTAAYMSPEQARGKGVDRRTDLWAFGVLLWEMLTGDRLFLGETISDTLAAILRADPDWDKLPADTPEEVKRLIARCLERDQRKRLRDIGEARVRLERWDRDPTSMHAPVTGEVPVVRDHAARRRLPWAVAALAIAAAGYLGLANHGAAPEVTTPLALNVDLRLPDLDILRVNAGANAILSPQGDRIAYLGEDGFIHVKVLAERATRRLEGTRNGQSLAFSPDGQWLAYANNTHLMRVAFAGGSPIEIVRTGDPRGVSWIDDTTLVYTTSYHTGLTIVSLADNTTRELTTLDTATNERSHRWPQVLPDGRHVLFQAQRLGRSYERSDLVVADLATGERRTVYSGGSYPRYARSGHLVFARERTLFAIAFDPVKLKVSGLPAPVLEDVRTLVVDQQNHDGAAAYDISQNGTLLYAPAGNQGIVRIAALDLATGVLSTLSEPGDYNMPRLSPDGRTLAVVATRQGRSAVRLIDTESGLVTPYGLADAFRDSTSWDIIQLDVDTGEARDFLALPDLQSAAQYSPDGKWVAYSQEVQGARRTLRVADAANPRRSVPVVDNLNGSVTFTWAPDSDGIVIRHQGAFSFYPLKFKDGQIRVEPPRILQREDFLNGRDFATANIQADLSRAIVMVPDGQDKADIGENCGILVTDWFRILTAKVPVASR